MTLDILDPTNFPNWDNLLLATPGYSFFHSSAWARVLKDSYGYTPMYFATIENGQFSALVPVMEVNSVLTGKRGVSLPFTDYCEPIVNEKIEFVDLFNRIIEYGKKCKWKYIELRGGDKFLRNQKAEGRRQEVGSSNHLSRNSKLATRNIFPCITYIGHSLNLLQDSEQIFSGFRDSTRRNIKKALKEGVAVKILNSLESVKEFYRLNCMTRKDHGLPPQPYYFFKKLYEHIISRGLGFVTLTSHNGQNIAGAVFFHFGDKGIYKYGASDMKFQDLRANNLAMWEGIRWFCNNGYRNFCFGRTELENKGLQQFKSGWGTEEQPIHYFKYDFRKKEFIKDSLEFKNIYHYVFKKMPAPLSNIVGSSLYRHVG